MDYKKYISFMKEAEKFKTCERDCHTTNVRRAESDAEHSWHLALFLLLLEKELKGIDILKTLKIALIHDLPEIYAGDTNPYRDNTDGKEEREKEAAEKLFSMLPDETSDELLSLFREYAQQKTKEAKIVKSVDKLMPLIQNLCTNKEYSAYRERKVTYDEVTEYMGQFFSGGIIKKFYDLLLSEADKKGVFHSKL